MDALYLDVLMSGQPFLTPAASGEVGIGGTKKQRSQRQDKRGSVNPSFVYILSYWRNEEREIGIRNCF